jgi:hypothetical protein
MVDSEIFLRRRCARGDRFEKGKNGVLLWGKTRVSFFSMEYISYSHWKLGGDKIVLVSENQDFPLLVMEHTSFGDGIRLELVRIMSLNYCVSLLIGESILFYS